MMARLERTFGWLAIPQLTLYLVCGQLATLLAIIARPAIANQIVLDPNQVLAGEYWRVFTFIVYPSFSTNPIFAAFALYFFWIMGTALENQWGEFRYNLYVFIAYIATVALAFAARNHGGPATNLFIVTSLFLAFAELFPDFVIYVMFIFPVRIKWLALVAWLFNAWSLIMGDWMTRAMVVASILNYLLFFWPDLVARVRTGRRSMLRQARTRTERQQAQAAFHTCAACGITDKTHPKMEFRYCPQCGGLGYCMDHLHNHVHRATATPST